jgi:hypothetical protein
MWRGNVPRKAKPVLEQDDSTREQIAALAHALWRERGCPDGSPEDDWFQAERRLEQDRKTKTVKTVSPVRQAAARA